MSLKEPMPCTVCGGETRFYDAFGRCVSCKNHDDHNVDMQIKYAAAQHSSYFRAISNGRI